MDVEETSPGEVGLPVTVSPFPVWLLSVARGEAAAGVSILLGVTTPATGYLEVPLLLSDLVKPDAQARVTAIGLPLQKKQLDLFRFFVQASIAMQLNNRKGYDVAYEQFGWKPDGSFLLGSRLYNGDAASTVTVADGRPGSAAIEATAIGTIEGWHAAAMPVTGPGMEFQLAAVLAAFAAPLWSLTDLPGCVLALIGTPGTGKSFGLKAGSAIYSTPTGQWVDIRTSDVTLANFAAMMRHLPVMIDEMRGIDPTVIASKVMMLTAGRSKERSDQSGRLRENVQSWQTITIASANHSLVETMDPAQAEGARERVLEIRTPPATVATLHKGAGLENELLRNKGVVGHHWVRVLQSAPIRAFILQRLAVVRQEIGAKMGETNADRVYVNLLGLLQVTAELVTKPQLGYLQFDVARFMAWILQQVIEQRHVNERFRSTSLDAIGDFINWARRNTVIIGSDGREIPGIPLNGAIYMRYEQGHDRLFIAQVPLLRFIRERGLSSQAVKLDLEKDGVLLDTNKVKNLGSGTSIRLGSVGTWVLDAAHPALTLVPRPVASAAAPAAVPPTYLRSVR